MMEVNTGENIRNCLWEVSGKALGGCRTEDGLHLKGENVESTEVPNEEALDDRIHKLCWTTKGGGHVGKAKGVV